MAGSMARLARFVPRLTGRQRPEFECWHPGDESEGDATAKFGIRVGIRLLPWEWMVLRAFNSVAEPNEHGEVVDAPCGAAGGDPSAGKGARRCDANPYDGRLVDDGRSSGGRRGVPPRRASPRVIGTFDVMRGHRCYEVTTIDGRTIVADADHLWTVQDTRRQRYVNGRRSNEFCEWKP